MNCEKYRPYAIKCPTSGSFGWRLWKNRFIWLFVGIFIGVWLGYAWHYAQVTQEHENQIGRLNTKYLDAREKVAILEAQLGVIQGKGRRK